jgi:hypothetical protein
MTLYVNIHTKQSRIPDLRLSKPYFTRTQVFRSVALCHWAGCSSQPGHLNTWRWRQYDTSKVSKHTPSDIAKSLKREPCLLLLAFCTLCDHMQTCWHDCADCQRGLLTVVGGSVVWHLYRDVSGEGADSVTVAVRVWVFHLETSDLVERLNQTIKTLQNVHLKRVLTSVEIRHFVTEVIYQQTHWSGIWDPLLKVNRVQYLAGWT